jgi:tetratricopeptide (TPR) repeat protein
MGEHDQAIADLNKAIELDPAHYKAYKNRGKAYAAQEDWDRALADYDQAIELKPKYDATYYDRAMAQKHRGNRDAAMADLARFLELCTDPEMCDRAKGQLAELRGR